MNKPLILWLAYKIEIFSSGNMGDTGNCTPIGYDMCELQKSFGNNANEASPDRMFGLRGLRVYQEVF
jgi:hypothetical protein